MKLKSKHKFAKTLAPDEEILLWNESHTLFILTNKRFLVHGAKLPDRKKQDYVFPIQTITKIYLDYFKEEKYGTRFKTLVVDSKGN